MAGNGTNGSKVTLLVGTTRGAFFFHSDAGRREWKMTGPHLDGWEIYSLYGDGRGGNGAGRVFAGTSHFVYGTTIRVRHTEKDELHLLSGRSVVLRRNEGSGLSRCHGVAASLVKREKGAMGCRCDSDLARGSPGPPSRRSARPCLDR